MFFGFAASRSEFMGREVLRQLDLDLPRTAGSDVALQACIGRTGASPEMGVVSLCGAKRKGVGLKGARKETKTLMLEVPLF